MHRKATRAGLLDAGEGLPGGEGAAAVTDPFAVKLILGQLPVNVGDAAVWNR